LESSDFQPLVDTMRNEGDTAILFYALEMNA
jgi:hypothetical protein